MMRDMIKMRGTIKMINNRCANLLRYTLVLLLMMTVGVGEMWGQTPHPYAGVWYMTVKKNTNYYMVPAANPQVNKANHVHEDAYFSSDYTTQAGDPEKPFITTYTTGGDFNSIWIFIPVSGENDYYYIVHALTGKYVKYQQYLTGNNARRKFVHLETIAAPGETEKFEITQLGNGVKIKPKNNAMYLNVAGDNQGRYNGGTTDPYYSGMVGGMSGTDDNSQFNLIDASSATDLTPVISEVNELNNTFTITSPAAAFSTIRYTTDGSTIPDASTGEEATSGSPIAITGNWKVQAVGVFGSFVTPIAGPKELEPAPCATPVITYDYTTSNVSITCATPGSTIYYTTDGTDPTTSSTEFSNSFSVTSPTTVKAFATHATISSSAVAELAITQVTTPTIQNNGYNAISITSATPGATIFYTTDGSTPTPSSTEYTAPLTENVSNVTIKAIAVRDNMITSAVGSGSVKLRCATPFITRDGMTFTLSCSMPTDATLYYKLGNGSETLYSGPVAFTPDKLPLNLTAVAGHNDYTDSEEASMELKNGSGTSEDPYLIYGSTDFANFITNVNNGTAASASYKLGSDVSASGVDAITTKFTGTFDGGYYTISGLTKPLFSSLNGATVKNVILNPNGTVSGNGAICNEAEGTTKIYNCGVLSGEISGSGNVGGLVGHVKSGSNVRVVNCYNFATVSGGTTMAGIVGNNEGTIGDVRIAMCMMYGNMSGTSPVYAGNHTSNVSNFTEYNYWRSKAELTYTTYNDQLAIDKDDYLTRFPFYRHILNTHRELAAYFLFGDYSSEHVSEIGHWVLNKRRGPLPHHRRMEEGYKKSP